MLDLPRIGTEVEPPQKKMDLVEYIRFCEFCARNNPHPTPENCLHRKTGEEEIKVPFHL